MVTKLDLHVHTRGSDGAGTPGEFIRSIKKAEIDGIVLTDHHRTLTVQGIEVAKAVRKAGLVCLVGCEYSTKEGHVLVYGMDVADLALGFYPPMQLLLDRVREAGGIAFPSHPFRGIKETLGGRIYQLQNLTHVEAYNGQNEAGNGFAATARPDADTMAVKAAVTMGLGEVGGSDAHFPERVGTCFTEFEASVRTTRDLLDALTSERHHAVVNATMVAEQKKRDEERWSLYSAQFKDDGNDPWWTHPLGMSPRARLDTYSGDSYLQGQTDYGYQEDPSGQYRFGYPDEDIPSWAYSDGGDSVQDFLRAEDRATKAPRKPRHGRSSRKRH